MEALYLVCGAHRPQLKRDPLDGGPIMHPRSCGFLPIAASLAVIGCGLFDRGFDVTGMVRYSNLGGDCWLIRAEDGRVFEPTNLPTEFHQDSLLVRATLEVRRDLASPCETGEIVDILQIARR